MATGPLPAFDVYARNVRSIRKGAADRPRDAHVRTTIAIAYAQAQADGYVRLKDAGADTLVEQWRAWCSATGLPMLQVWEQRGIARVVVDLSFTTRRFSVAELAWVRDRWRGHTLQPTAVCELTSHGCVLEGLRVPQAHALAASVLALLHGPALL